jgi:hypothetical protein
MLVYQRAALLLPSIPGLSHLKLAVAGGSCFKNHYRMGHHFYLGWLKNMIQR